MQYLFLLLGVASLLGVILGLIKPSLVLRWGAKRTRLHAVAWYVLFTMLCLVGIGVTAPKSQKSVSPTAAQKTQTAPAATAEAPSAPAVSQPTQPIRPAEPAPIAAASPAKPAPAETKTVEKPLYKIGTEVPGRNFAYVVNSVQFAKRIGNSFVNETADGIFLLVNMTIRNTDNETHSLTSGLFTIEDENGTAYDYSVRGGTTLMMSGGKTFILKQCQPQIPTKGTLIFEVPRKSGQYSLVLSGGFFSEPTKIALR